MTGIVTDPAWPEGSRTALAAGNACAFIFTSWNLPELEELVTRALYLPPAPAALQRKAIRQVQIPQVQWDVHVRRKNVQKNRFTVRKQVSLANSRQISRIHVWVKMLECWLRKNWRIASRMGRLLASITLVTGSLKKSLKFHHFKKKRSKSRFQYMNWLKYNGNWADMISNSENFLLILQLNQYIFILKVIFTLVIVCTLCNFMHVKSEKWPARHKNNTTV